MLVAGTIKVTDLLCTTLPPTPAGALSMAQLVELRPADTGLAPEKIVSRDALRHSGAHQAG